MANDEDLCLTVADCDVLLEALESYEKEPKIMNMIGTITLRALGEKQDGPIERMLDETSKVEHVTRKTAAALLHRKLRVLQGELAYDEGNKK
jgi:hypothetical protein